MILKSLSRSSGSTGQLVNYIFRYILEKEKVEKEEKEAKSVPFTKENLPEYYEAFKEGQLNFDSPPDMEILKSKSKLEQELNAAIRISKTTSIAKELATRMKADGRDLKQTSLHLSSRYLIARNTEGDQLYKISLPTLFTSQKIEENPKEAPFIIRHNLRSRSIKGYIREFEKNESLRITRTKASVSIFHHILSFSSKDKEQVTDAMLKDMADKLIALRAPDCLYVGTKHIDHDHIHIHLAMSAVDLAGRSVRISKSKFQEIKKELDRYQKEHWPNLVHSLPEHGKKERMKDRERVVEKSKTQRPLEKDILLTVLESAYQSSTSTEQFLSLLQDNGYSPYYRSGTLTGVSVENLRFRFSRLGYSQEKIKALSLLQEKEEKELEELHRLRDAKNRATVVERISAMNALQPESPTSSLEVSDSSQSRDTEEVSSKDIASKNDEQSSVEMEEKEVDNTPTVEDESDSRSR